MLQPYNIWIEGIEFKYVLNHATPIWRGAHDLCEDLGMIQRARDKSSEYFVSVAENVLERLVALHTDDPERI